MINDIQLYKHTLTFLLTESACEERVFPPVEFKNDAIWPQKYIDIIAQKRSYISNKIFPSISYVINTRLRACQSFSDALHIHWNTTWVTFWFSCCKYRQCSHHCQSTGNSGQESS